MRDSALRSAVTRRRLAVAGGIGLALWLGAGTAAADVCEQVPFCQVQSETPFRMGGWATQAHSFTCRGEYPYVWNFSYSQTGSPSVSAIGGVDAVSPGTMGILFTNWNPFQTDTVTVDLACSKSNSFGGDCGAVVDDPKCPVVAGSEKTYCSKGPVPVCIGTYQERCQPSNQLYSCTIDVIPVPWCQPCPG
jgi:hypothetical protein